MKKRILLILFIIFLCFCYYSFFTGERKIYYYSNGTCTLTRVAYSNTWEMWEDLYYGRLEYDDIDRSKSYIHCEYRGGLNAMMQYCIHFESDSIFIYHLDGAFFKVNCNNDKFILIADLLSDPPEDNTVHFTFGYDVLRFRDTKERNIVMEDIPSQYTLRFFSHIRSKNVCEFYERDGERECLKRLQKNQMTKPLE